jgi:large subunit ribosomal protein L25
MARRVELKAEAREKIGRGPSGRLRKGGVVPGIVYGKKKEPKKVQMQEKDVQKLFKHASSENILVDLKLGTESKMVFIKEIQHDPLTDRFLHIDLHEVASDEKMRARLPTLSKGEPIGVKTGGGILEHTLHEIEVECLPNDLPGYIEIDVSHLEMGKAFHVGELNLGEKIRILTHKELPIFSVVAPQKEEELVPATADAAAVEATEQGPEGEPVEGAAEKGKGEKAAKPEAGVKPSDAKTPAAAKPDAKAAAPAKGEKK